MKRFVDIASHASFVLIFGYGATLITVHIANNIMATLP